MTVYTNKNKLIAEEKLKKKLLTQVSKKFGREIREFDKTFGDQYRFYKW